MISNCAVGASTTPDRVAEFSDIATEFACKNERQKQLLNYVYQRVANIRPFPPQPGEKVNVSEEACSHTERLWANLRTLQESNDTLEFILNHLQTLA